MRNLYFVLITLFTANCIYANNAATASEQGEIMCTLKGRLPGAETSWIGDKSGIQGTNDWGDETYTNSFSSDNGVFIFNNNYTISQYGNYWSGFAYTNTTDVTTPDFSNVSAITGKGSSGNPDMAYITAYIGVTPTITFAKNASFNNLGMYVTNATYTYLSMKNGDTFAKKFGGADGTDPDWLKLTATGYDQTGKETGTVDIYLADYTSAKSSEDYLVDKWQWVDLSSLGTVTSIAFSMSSSDTGEYGMNTPGYFCMDGLRGKMVGGVGIENTDKTASTIYYADGSLHIQGLANAEIRVISVTGITVAAFIADSDNTITPINLNKGIYIVQVVKAGKATAYKINVH